MFVLPHARVEDLIVDDVDGGAGREQGMQLRLSMVETVLSLSQRVWVHLLKL